MRHMRVLLPMCSLPVRFGCLLIACREHHALVMHLDHHAATICSLSVLAASCPLFPLSHVSTSLFASCLSTPMKGPRHRWES